MLVVGTHALLEERLRFPRLALAIVDEQHRFGVRQRAALAGKGLLPHMLVLSATPIPRTLQLAWFGDLELSVMRERPRGRGRLVTRVTGEERFPQVVEFMARELAAGRQAFVVVPAIEEGSRADLRAAETELERLRGHPLMATYRLGLLHGRMKPDEKQAAMDAFRAGELHVLVATTVVEVTAPAPDFGLVINPASLAVSRNSSGEIVVQIDRSHGFTGKVTVSVPDNQVLKPLKIKLTPNAQSTSDNSVTFHYKIKKKAPLGVQQIIFTGKDESGVVRTATLTFNIS